MLMFIITGWGEPVSHLMIKLPDFLDDILISLIYWF